MQVYCLTTKEKYDYFLLYIKSLKLLNFTSFKMLKSQTSN